MEYLWTILLGATQGATEFLPVSSSGHLAVGQLLMSSGELKSFLDEQPFLLEILFHLATLIAVVVVYRKDVAALFIGAKEGTTSIFSGTFSKTIKENPRVGMLLALIVGTIPTGIIGYCMSDVASAVSNSPLLLGMSFLGCAAVLFAGRFFGGGEKNLTLKTALIIGIVQGIAVLPGLSRSGITISVALALGINREEAAKFSFLLSIPAILGATVLKLEPSALASNDHLAPLLAGALAAFLVGLAALVVLIKIVKAGRLWAFAPYVATMGIASIAFF